MGRFRLLRLCTFALCVLVLPAWAYAQAEIAGVVRDASGGVLPGVTVEAASPQLIEKVRTTVTSDSGQYRILSLVPGEYTLTFTLPGFAVVKREGIQLTGSFAATINAELRVGGLEETITVTGAAPVVDVQSTKAQTVMTRQVLDAIPAGRSHLTQAILVPGLSASQGAARGNTMDVGGTRNLQNTLVSIHGGRDGDTRVQIDGVRIGNLSGAGQWHNYVPDQGMTQELVIDYGAVNAEEISAGLRINYVPKEGGNTFRGTPSSRRQRGLAGQQHHARAEGSRPRLAQQAAADVVDPVMGKLTGALFFLVDASFPLGRGGAACGRVLLHHPAARPACGSYHIILKGSGWASIPGVTSTWFEAGDVLVLPHGDPYSMLSAPGQPPEFDAEATMDYFRDMAAGRLPFVTREGGGGEPRSEFVCGFLGCDMQPFNPVLSTLPRLLRVKRSRNGREGLPEPPYRPHARRGAPAAGWRRVDPAETERADFCRGGAPVSGDPAGPRDWLAVRPARSYNWQSPGHAP